MKVKRAIKKIVALGTGATMLGATVLGAMAADLSTYPAPFVENGNANTWIVVGDGAKIADVVGAMNIAASLQYAMKQEASDGTSSTSVSVSGDAYRIDKSSNFVELEENIDTIGITTLGESEMEVLAGGTFKNKKSSYSYDEYLSVADTANVTYTVDPDADGDMEDVPAPYLLFAKGTGATTGHTGYAYQYKLSFPTAAEEDLSTTPLDWNGFENKNIVMLGNEYEMVDVVQSGVAQMVIEMLGGAASDTLDVGETKTYTVAGKDYEVTALAVCDTCGPTSSAAAKLKVNGQVTDSLEAGDTESLDDGTEIGVKDVFPTSGDALPDLVEFYVGAQKITLTDDNIMDTNWKASGYKVGTETINDVWVRIIGTNTSTTGKLNSIEIAWVPGEDKYVGIGQKLSDKEDEDGQVMFGAFDIEFLGLTEAAMYDIEIKNRGDDEYKMTFINSDGYEIEFPLLDVDNATAALAINWGEETDDLIFTEPTGAASAPTYAIGDEDYFILTDTAGKATTVMQFKSVSASDDQLTFKNLATGEDVTITHDGTPGANGNVAGGDATLTVGSKSYAVWVKSDETAIAVDVDGSNTLAGTEVPIWTKGGLKIDIDVDGDDECDGDVLKLTTENLGTSATAEAVTIGFSLGTSASNPSVDIGTISSDTTLTANIMQSVGDSDNKAGMSAFGMMFDQTGDTSGPDTLKISYPDDQTEMQVFYTAGATTSTSTSSSGSTYTINQMPVTAAKRDSEVADVAAQNLIVVGGPCINTVAAELMGNPESCAEGFEEGKAKLKLFDNDGKYALLVAGYTADDTTRATRVLARYSDYDLSGTEVEVTGTTLTDISVSTI